MTKEWQTKKKEKKRKRGENLRQFWCVRGRCSLPDSKCQVIQTYSCPLKGLSVVKTQALRIPPWPLCSSSSARNNSLKKWANSVHSFSLFRSFSSNFLLNKNCWTSAGFDLGSSERHKSAILLVWSFFLSIELFALFDKSLFNCDDSKNLLRITELNRYFAPIISVVDVLMLFEQNVDLHLIYQDNITFITAVCWKVVYWLECRYAVISNLLCPLAPEFMQNAHERQIKACAYFIPQRSLQGREPRSSGYGRKLMFRRSWVWIPALYTEWTFFHILICCKNCNVCLRRRK